MSECLPARWATPLCYSMCWLVTTRRTATRVRLRRHKRHFTAVIGLSLRADLPVVHELLSDPHARVRSLVRPDAIERLMNARPDRWGALTAWTVQILPVLMVECWLRALEDGAFAENMLADERLAQTQIRFVESAARG